jgi:hypothetical protein
MSTISLRQTAPIRVDEENISRPLTNVEIDANFINLNNTKIENDGSVPIEQIVFDGQNTDNATYGVVWFDSTHTNSGVYPGANGQVVFNGDVRIRGTLNAANTATTQQFTTTSKDIILNEEITPGNFISSIAECSGAGLKGGDSGGGTGYISFLYDNTIASWKASTFDATPIYFSANDFKIGNSTTETLTGAHSQLDVINDMLKTNGATAGTDFTPATLNTISDNQSLKQAIEALDGENIPLLKSRVGVSGVTQTLPWTLNTNSQTAGQSGYNPGIPLNQNDSIFSVLQILHQAILFNVSRVESKTSSFNAYSGHLYLVTPSAGQDVPINLPSTKRGRIAIRLEDDNTRTCSIASLSGSGGLIEGVPENSSLIIDTELQTVELLWDTVNSIWRVL